MIITMQGNWTVAVKSKNASFPQRFVVQGAASGNGTYTGTVGTTAFVTGNEWSISIQNNPGTGWQASGTKLLFPHQVGGQYQFDIQSNDAGADQDFDDLVLTCSTPVNINDFVLFGNVTLYSGSCIFNPCRKFPYVIETAAALEAALKNRVLDDWIKKYYPERVPGYVNPNPPDPAYFAPIVFDLTGEATQPNTALQYKRIATTDKAKGAKATTETGATMLASDFERISSSAQSTDLFKVQSSDTISLAKNIGGLFRHCITDAGSNLTLTFEEYDRTAAELLGGAYTGTGDRRLLGSTITDMNGNYIFFFNFGMTPPDLEDETDIASGEDIGYALFPDVIVKIVSSSPARVIYESAPYYNIPNLKRIDICLPESAVQVTSVCFNGNLIGSLGNVFIGGSQNSSASFATPALQRYDVANANFLEANGVISVGSPLAGFNVSCAAWGGTIDIRGCMYDAAKSAVDNKIHWYTIQIARFGGGWTYVTENYKQPLYGSPVLGNVGPFYPSPGGVLNGTVAAYKNIQREAFVDNVPWVFDQIDRYMQLHTSIYDTIAGVSTPGTFYLRVDGYDASGNLVANATDLIALYIHNKPLNFQLTSPVLADSSIVDAGCGLFRLTDTQMKTHMIFSFEASDPLGFVNTYALTMNRCPGTALNIDSDKWGNFTIAGSYTFPGGSNPSVPHVCVGYTGTQHDYTTSGPITAEIEPSATADGWLETGEYFAVYSFGLTASQRITNGYNNGVTGNYVTSSQIMMERLNP